MVLDLMAKQEQKKQEINDRIESNLHKHAIARVDKFKKKATEKMDLIEQFRQTLQNTEWKQYETEKQKQMKRI